MQATSVPPLFPFSDIQIFLAIVVALLAAFLTRWVILFIEKKRFTLQAIASSFVLGGIAAVLVTWIGSLLPLVDEADGSVHVFMSVYDLWISSMFAAVLMVIGWAGVQRFRQHQQKADQALAQATHAAEEDAARRAAQKTKIFISYRREGDAALAGRVADLLESEFGPDHVFMDVDAIQLGVDFVKIINEEVAKCDVLLAVIGRNWLDAQSDDGKRRLDNAADFVRIEIAAALKRQIPVIPMLVDGAKIPPADRLPGELQELARRNALDLRNATFKSDMDRLVLGLKKIKVS